MVVFTVICMPFWNATTDAYTRGDMDWIKKASRKLDFIMIGLFITMLFMVIISKFIYTLWVGSEIEIPHSLSASVGIYIFILAFSMRYSYLLNGIGALKLQLIMTTGATIVFLPIAIQACHTFGTVTSLVYVMCLVNLPGLFVNMIQFHKILNGTATGIWRL
jgi:O-antigen/teichoic acid export membrane protein